MHTVVDFIGNIDWASPQAGVLVVLLTVLALLRKWFVLVMVLLVITLGRGLCHLQMNRELLSETGLTTSTIVYFTGGTFTAVVAAVQFFAGDWASASNTRGQRRKRPAR